MWISNSRNNFAPFAGLMLVGFEKPRRSSQEREADGLEADRETTETENGIDDVAV